MFGFAIDSDEEDFFAEFTIEEPKQGSEEEDPFKEFELDFDRVDEQQNTNMVRLRAEYFS